MTDDHISMIINIRDINVKTRTRIGEYRIGLTHREITPWNIINSIMSYSHSDSDVMVLRPEIIIILFEDICVLISSKVIS